jgi:outer membrane protein assembly factor BamB
VAGAIGLGCDGVSGNRLVAGALAVLAGTLVIGGCTQAHPPHRAAVSRRGRPPAPVAVTDQDWAAYLGGPLHSSYNASQTAITPATAPDLTLKWWQGRHAIYLASPTVADGAVFIGADSGWFYKLDQATGAVLAKVFIGFQRGITCPGRGVVDTATVALSPVTHQPTVYVGGPDGYLYAFSASNLSLDWKSVIGIPSTKVNNYFEWSSPTVANGKIYIGVSSGCDQPLIYGGLNAYDQATGQELAEFHTVPRGDIGGSIWSSAAVAPDGDVYTSVGNGPVSAPELLYSESIVKLNPDTLKPLGYFQVPPSQVTFDGDFGGSPVFFGNDVGACDKNGIFYALDQSTMKVAWEQRIGAPSGNVTYAQCSAAPAYNGKDLFIGGPGVTIGGTYYAGSVQERDPANGALIWETGLPNAVIGSPTLDGGGVVAAGTFAYSRIPDATYLIDAATGKIIRTLVSGIDFGQSVFADGWLYTANGTGVYAWAVNGGPPG